MIIARGNRAHILHTAHGATCGHINADINDLDEMIKARVLESIPSIIFVKSIKIKLITLDHFFIILLPLLKD